MQKNEKACPLCLAGRQATRRGSGLIFAVVLLFVILGMVVTLSSVTVLETKMSQKTKSSIGAFYNSESGVEWALNQISTKSNTDSISSIDGWDSLKKLAVCPISDCSVYFLDEKGKVIIDPDAEISTIKAVRSVGTQTVGETTQRAIEAAVAALTCSQVTVPCSGSDSCEADCDDGATAMGGGFTGASLANAIKSSYPVDNLGVKGWKVETEVTGDINAYVICCK